MGIQSRSLSGRHVSTSFLDPVLEAMMKQVCWHSRRSKAYRGLPEARMAASRLLRMCWLRRGLPRLLLAPFTASSESEKCHRRYTSCTGSPSRVLLGSCASSSAVSVAGGWWVAAVGFVVVLQRYRSCGSWACPDGLVSGWTWCWVAFGGTLRVDLKSQSLVIESFSVGSRAVLSTMGRFWRQQVQSLLWPSF